MVFSSLIFLFFFLPAALFCYYIVPQNFIRVRNAVLLLFSLFFYFYGEPRLIGILIFSILMNYLFGLSMRSTYRKPLLIWCVIANLSLLGVFKYLNFFISSADSLFGLGIPVPDIVMPIGISFYTFQALSYVIDVYRREVPPQHDLFSLALYVSMFPQLIAGPIVRYHDVNVQLAVRKHSFAQFSEGISRFLFGLSKKVLLSNVFAQIADGVFKYAPNELSAAGAWMGAIGYTLQIYFDFSGYSDMAIGLGKMFGFEFLENFNYPYISASVTEFWRRWHISLSTFFRDYVYIPLGGNRVSQLRHILNLLIVWALTGFWHGASWNFLLWGLYYFVFLVLEKYVFTDRFQRTPKVVSHLLTLFVISFGWMIFRCDKLSYVGKIFLGLFGLTGNGFTNYETTTALKANFLFLIIAILACTPLVKKLGEVLQDRAASESKALTVLNVINVAGPIVLLLLSTAALVGDSYNPFLYFRF